ncbi:MAG: HEAT repeat domain-containing protein, partial [Candidatus Brocadiia bacterium]|nr:HEAT repeat domain-containing protein [Candidatus Brocadiia bacterium]
LGTGFAANEAGRGASSLFEDGLRLYKAGDYADAREVFEQVLAARPGSGATLEMFDKAEVGMLLEMREVPELLESVGLLLEMRRAAIQQSLRHVQAPDALLSDLQSTDLDTYMRARAALLAHGPYAVPCLLDLLARKPPDEADGPIELDGESVPRTVTRTVAILGNMRHDICMPLLAALESEDPFLRTRLCFVLGHVGDRRAVPALLALAQTGDPAAPVATAAREALEQITDRSPDRLGTPLEHYQALVGQYLKEDTASVGYAFGDRTEVWLWDSAGARPRERLTYEDVPAYLYYQRQGAEFAIEALELYPDDQSLRGMLVALLVRQLELVSAALEIEPDSAARAEAQARKDKLVVDLPVACHLYGPDEVGLALDHAVALGHGTAAIYLVRQLADNVGAQRGTAAQALSRTLEMPDKDARYLAAIAIMNLSPAGEIGEPENVVQVLAATLRYTELRTALLPFDNLQARNTLATVLRGLGLSILPADMNPGTIANVLALEPAVDMVFVEANVAQEAMGKVMDKLSGDLRTKAVPLYVIRDPASESADLGEYAGMIDGVLSPDHVRATELAPLVRPAIQRRPSPFAVERGETVLLAARTILAVDPATTAYPLIELEPSLVAALWGYGEATADTAATALARFGSLASVPALAELVSADETTEELKVVACRAIAAIAERTAEPVPQDAMKALAAALAIGPQPVREAAAEAMGAGALAPEQALELIDGYAAPFAGEGTPSPPAEPAALTPAKVWGARPDTLVTPGPTPAEPVEPTPAEPREGIGDGWDIQIS